ncbi:MAG: GNAT family N-acetyltransferase [Clostridia bacterium]|nr:GNAT family N-acetyltransferase [Clostridia bacterium]
MQQKSEEDMVLKFEKMTVEHAKEIMDIFNYYIENSFAAYPDTKLPYEFYGKFLEMTKGYPAFAMKDENKDRVLGFCFLRAYNPFPVFKEAAEISYFIHKDDVGKGIGEEALNVLQQEAKKMGIRNLLASISSENEQSLKFHRKNGFRECGRLHQIGNKKGKRFDVVWMEKEL